jgi:fatty acid desaturase
MSRVEPDQSRAFLATLSPAKRAAIRELHKVRPAWNAVALVYAALWIGTAFLVVQVSSWPLRVLGYLVMGASLHSLGVLMHEGVHGNLFRKRNLDRWGAFLLGAPTLVSGAAYRVTHRLHHRHNRTEDDPDEFGNYVRSPRLLSAAFYAWGVIGMLVFLVHVPVHAYRRATARDRVEILLEYGLLALLYTVVCLLAVRAGALPLLLHGWLYPMVVVTAIVNIRGWSEHMLTQPGSALTQTRTVRSNRLVRFFLLNLNFHLEHHLFPSVPWYNVPHLHALLEDDFRVAGAYVYDSYARFLWDAIRIGVHGHAPAVPPASDRPLPAEAAGESPAEATLGSMR